MNKQVDFFKEHPFSKFSAEEEIEYLNDIYFKANYYSEIFNNLKTSSSRFIIGSIGVSRYLKNTIRNLIILPIFAIKFA